MMPSFYAMGGLPAHCACGISFTVEHALSCPKGGLSSIRHNEIRDLTTRCHFVNRSVFTSCKGQSYSLCPNWTICLPPSSRRSFVDVRAFNPLAVSNASSSLSSNYHRHESIKKCACICTLCKQREHATFTPLIMSASRGFAHEASIFYKRLASLLATKVTCILRLWVD